MLQNLRLNFNSVYDAQVTDGTGHTFGGGKETCAHKRGFRGACWCHGLSQFDNVSDPPEHQQTLLRAILFVIGKSFLSKTMQNTLEANCETFSIRETYSDDF